jgi:hypothetical protein
LLEHHPCISLTYKPVQIDSISPDIVTLLVLNGPTETLRPTWHVVTMAYRSAVMYYSYGENPMAIFESIYLYLLHIHRIQNISYTTVQLVIERRPVNEYVVTSPLQLTKTNKYIS